MEEREQSLPRETDVKEMDSTDQATGLATEMQRETPCRTDGEISTEARERFLDREQAPPRGIANEGGNYNDQSGTREERVEAGRVEIQAEAGGKYGPMG